jgi:hypothetical protein
MILTQEYSRVANSTERAWLISPQGEIYSCGSDHENCYGLKELRSLGDESNLDNLVEELMKKGFVKVGAFVGEGYAYLHGDGFNDRELKAYQDILSNLNFNDSMSVEVITGEYEKYDVFPYKEFRYFESLRDLNKYKRYIGLQ